MRQLSLFTLLASIPLLFACQNDISESISAEDTLVYASALRGEAPQTPGTSQDEAPKPLRLCHLSDIRTAIAENPGLDSAAESSRSTKDKMHRSDEKKAQRGFKNKHKYRKHLLRRVLRLYDGDQSGNLSQEEKNELENDLNTRCDNIKAKRLADYDSDGSGDLNEEEWNALLAARQENFSQKRSEILEQYDSDEDGVLSRQEKKALRQDKRETFRTKRQELRATFDANQDGELDEDERTALRTYLKEWIRGEHLEESGGPLFLKHWHPAKG